MNNKKAIELLEEVLKPLLACEPQCKLNLNPNKLVQALSLLKQPCVKCGGNPRGVPGKDGGWTTCPDCKGTGKQSETYSIFTADELLELSAKAAPSIQQPDCPPSEFVKEMRKWVEIFRGGPIMETSWPKNLLKALKIITDRDKTIADQSAALNPIRDWYGNRSDLEILTDAIADLQKDRAKVLDQATQIKRLEKLLGTAACRLSVDDLLYKTITEALKG